MNKTMARRAALIAGTAVLVGGSFLAPAQALGGTCTVWSEKTVVSGAPDNWRVGAKCTTIQSDTKAQGVGVVSFYPDHKTPWFTQLNVNKYSSWGIGANDSLSLTTRPADTEI